MFHYLIHNRPKTHKMSNLSEIGTIKNWTGFDLHLYLCLFKCIGYWSSSYWHKLPLPNPHLPLANLWALTSFDKSSINPISLALKSTSRKKSIMNTITHWLKNFATLVESPSFSTSTLPNSKKVNHPIDSDVLNLEEPDKKVSSVLHEAFMSFD